MSTELSRAKEIPVLIVAAILAVVQVMVEELFHGGTK